MVMKPSLLAFRPGYYIRNVCGNIINSWHGGLRNPKDIVELNAKGMATAIKGSLDEPLRFISQKGHTRGNFIQKAIKEVAEVANFNMDDVAVKVEGKEITWKEIYKLANKNGLMRRGAATADMLFTKAHDLKKWGKFKDKALDAASGRQILETMSFFEDGAKIALFTDQLPQQ